MSRKLILFMILATISYAIDSINQDDYQWMQVTGVQAIQNMKSSPIFKQVNTQAISFWQIQEHQTLNQVSQIDHLFLNKIHYFRITYQSTRTDREYNEVIITVRVAVTQKRKIMVTRTIPLVAIADNSDGYISNY